MLLNLTTQLLLCFLKFSQSQKTLLMSNCINMQIKNQRIFILKIEIYLEMSHSELRYICFLNV